MAGCCNEDNLVWTPVSANSQSAGWTGTVGTQHVSATIAGPNFTINGPIRGIRYRSPDFGAPSSPDGDGASVTNITTAQTGFIQPAISFAAVPNFPAPAAPGPFSAVVSGITVTINSDGRLTRRLNNGWLLDVRNNRPPNSPDIQWITYEFSAPVTNVLLTFAGFNGSGPSQAANTAEGVSQLEILVEGPCPCCPLALERTQCYTVEELQVLFDTVVMTHNPNGYVVGSIGRMIDQDIAGANFTGFSTTPVQITDAQSPTWEFTFNTPQNNITRVQEYNQGGGDLNDFDGFGSVLLQVFSSTNALLFSGTFTMGNGGAPFGLVFPTPLDDVKRMTWSLMKKLNPGATVAPLSREFQAFRDPVRYATAVYCDGEIHWFDVETGDLVSPRNFIPC